MKKKILSIVLVAVMLLAAIPAFSVAASDPPVETLMDYNYYRTVITNETIVVDGMLDDTYRNSQKITGTATGVSFEAYNVVTPRGMYVFAAVNGESFRVYALMDDGRASSWGYYEITKDGNVTATTKSGATLLEATVVTETVSSGGWKAEIYIPFTVQILNYTNYNLSIALSATNGSSTCYDRSEASNAATSSANYKPLRLVRYINRASDASPTYMYKSSDIYTNDDVPVYGELINSAVYVAGGGFTMDGKKDAKYSEHNKIPLMTWITYVDGNATPVATPVSDMGWVYTAFDDNNLYVYYERYDEDLTGYEQLTTNYYFDDGETVTAGGFNVVFKDSSYVGYWSASEGTTSYGWPEGSVLQKISGAGRYVDNTGNNVHGIEYTLPLPEGIKEKLANDEDVSFKISFNTKNESYKDDGKTRYNVCLGGSHHYSEWFYQFDTDTAKYGEEFISEKTYGTTMILSKNFTNDAYGKITGASLSLDSDIIFNYRATLGTGDVNNAYMKFTRGETEYIAYPQAIAGSTQYKFSYKGLAPQTLGDEIKAELYIDGKLVDTKNNYSARQNLVNLLAVKEYANNVKLNNLMKSLMNYGAAAQGYAKYKTDTLINQDYKVELLSPKEADNKKYIGAPIDADTKLTALGVYFDSVNKMYVKFIAPSLDGVTVTFNGVKADIEKSGSQYIAYSDGVTVSQFHLTYEIVLTTKAGSQTATYSINSYAYAKLNSTDDAMVELAKATYTYGDCAKTYTGLGDTTYTIMTYNDASNDSPYVNNYNDVVNIIKDCNPDIVGFQEIQQTHNSKYTSLFSTAGYTWKWYNRQYSTTAEHWTGDLAKPSGVAVAYNAAKFEKLNEWPRWYGSNPETVSAPVGASYTFNFVVVLFKDKATNQEFLFICAHADYISAAINKENVRVILQEVNKIDASLKGTSANYSGKKIFVGDWNCNPGIGGYELMNQNGYYTAEAQIANSYKPSTAPNGANIDFVFTNPGEFSAIKHKVVNDHPSAIWTSDHYPVWAKLVWSQGYDVELLKPIYEFPDLPKDPDYNDWGDDFYTDDDIIYTTK